ncbi:hypothetical protein [Magnetospirillum sp. ME-1]|uniref:hypothetical protein n=1 Tax=Magnetospirillum sp. ME-1 TaxID=1639348 RepID=UPI0011AE8DEC|nr:hypothetical protein [Magnetospirillum sp. ME-1]
MFEHFAKWGTPHVMTPVTPVKNEVSHPVSCLKAAENKAFTAVVTPVTPMTPENAEVCKRTEEKPKSEAHFITSYLDAIHAPTDPGICRLCGKEGTDGAAIVPFGGKSAGHVWLHPGCWAEWMEGRQAEARAAYAEWSVNAEPGEGAP